MRLLEEDIKKIKNEKGKTRAQKRESYYVAIENYFNKYGAITCKCCGHRQVIINIHHEWLDGGQHALCVYCHAIISNIIYPSASSFIWEEIAERECWEKESDLTPKKEDMIDGLHKLGYYSSNDIFRLVRKIRNINLNKEKKEKC